MCVVFKRYFMYQRKTLYVQLLISFNILFVIEIVRYHAYDHDRTSPKAESSLLAMDKNNIDHNLTIERYFWRRKFWKTSNLGSILFKMEHKNKFKKKKHRTFVILFWKYWYWLKNRHVYSFKGKIGKRRILDKCSVSNCIFTGNDSKINTVDVVLVHIQKGEIPIVENRNQRQIWVFLEDESPRNAFSLSKKRPDLKEWENVFNWSMTYRTISDVPVPYGRTVPLRKRLYPEVSEKTISKLIPNLSAKRPEVLVALVTSHCIKFRMNFLENLREYIQVDVYGGCSRDKFLKRQCPGHFKKDCPALKKYYFYLVIENAMCSQYITEKVFRNAYSKGAIPIIIGATEHDAKTLLPPNSYIHWNNNMTHKDLAEKIINTYENKEEYLSYHLWRNDFEVRNEHGYLGTQSYHLCRLCEALNYNKKKTKTYTFNDLNQYLNPNLLCKDMS
ncbi:3-galactosyl-N-acetylglucosaminide 4-alpha-L-fucosyltransferase FUT3-like [Plodia interpunctella]|uniref:3-galactosyl-N-acetylglucosaminide 4-alpha-L-fucosyltransferase FUT3-like n=1 Tax=Plodia interpunctella TaxID=58824 RepID=UPI0023686ACA|nr:3-galactosyl-N-acetylglucosaminide 4-alpha-L-fucosyltransferase FUT3-like [Plodia interpunctella]